MLFGFRGMVWFDLGLLVGGVFCFRGSVRFVVGLLISLVNFVVVVAVGVG